MERETSEIVPYEPSMRELEPAAFVHALEQEKEKRAALEQYIRSQLREGVDWGRIDFRGKESKPTLFKPGAEKVASLLRLRTSFERDEESCTMLGPDGEGVVAYICRLTTGHGEVVGEGRGACGRERADVNTRVKIALKRAMVDAVLRVAALSDHFTQDLEDYDQTPRRKPELPGRDVKAPANLEQPAWFSETTGFGRKKKTKITIEGEDRLLEDVTWGTLAQGSVGGVRYKFVADTLDWAKQQDNPGRTVRQFIERAPVVLRCMERRETAEAADKEF